MSYSNDFDNQFGTNMFDESNFRFLNGVELPPIVPRDDITENPASTDTTGFTGDPDLDWALKDPDQDDDVIGAGLDAFAKEYADFQLANDDNSVLQNNEPTTPATVSNDTEPALPKPTPATASNDTEPALRQLAAKQVNNSNLPGADLAAQPLSNPSSYGQSGYVNPSPQNSGGYPPMNNASPYPQPSLYGSPGYVNPSPPQNSGGYLHSAPPYPLPNPYGQLGYVSPSPPQNSGGYLPTNNASPYGQSGYMNPSPQNSRGYSQLGHTPIPVQYPAQNFGSLPQSGHSAVVEDPFSSKYLPYDLGSFGKSPDIGTQNGGSNDATSDAINAVLEEFRKNSQNGSPSRSTQGSRNSSASRVTKPRSNHSHGSSPARGSPSSSRNQPRQTTTGNGISGSPRRGQEKPATHQDTSGFINYNYNDFCPDNTYQPNPDLGFSERPNNPNLKPLKAEHSAVSEQPIYAQFQGIFANAEEARAHRKETRIPPKQASDLEKVKTEGEGFWTHRIYQSMIDISYLRDTEHSIHVKRFTKEDGKVFTQADLEAAAFHVFLAAIKVHEYGWTRHKVFHTEHKRGKKKDNSTTIEQRLESICVALRIAKACVDDALRGGLSLALLCDNPVARQFTKESNNAGNSARSERLKLAKKVAKGEVEGEEEGEESEEEEE